MAGNSQEETITEINRRKAKLSIIRQRDNKFRFHIDYNKGKHTEGAKDYASLIECGLDAIIQLHNVLKVHA